MTDPVRVSTVLRSPIDGTGALDPLVAGVRARGLVILAGAGTSMLAPTSLPSWWAFNEAVLTALAERLSERTNRQFSAERLSALLARRKATRSFTPDFMAQLMEEEAGLGYFRVLQTLDTTTPNDNHEAIAALARTGLLRAVVTTNFDRLVERALEAGGVPHRVFATVADFETLSDALGGYSGCLVIKVHGSVEHLDSMVDTLAQRVAGRPKVLEDAITALLERHACLALGFSGADLAYDEEYLGLRRAAEHAIEFSVLNRVGDEPLEAMVRLVAAYGPRARILDGQLPSAFHAVLGALKVDAAPLRQAPEAGESPAERLAQRTRAWVNDLGTVTALNMFTSLVDSNAHDETMLRFMMYFKRYYRTTEDGLDSAHWRFEYNFGRRLLEEGLLGQIDTEEAGLTIPGIRDIEASAYADARQFLFRAGHRDLGGLLEGRIEETRALALTYGPGRVMGNVQQILDEIEQEPPSRVVADAYLMAAECLELIGRYEKAVACASAAYRAARAIGDDPRRGAIGARAARVLALAKATDVARALCREALEIGTRLDLPIIEADALAAQGLIEVFATRDPQATGNAIGPLSRACAIYRYHRRRPRLLLALCDLVRATYYAGSKQQFGAAMDELDQLAPLLPGLQVTAVLVKIELLMFARATDTARVEIERLRVIAREDRNEWGLARAEKLLLELDGSDSS